MVKQVRPMTIHMQYEDGSPRWSLSIEPGVELSIEDLETMLMWSEEYLPTNATADAWNGLINQVAGYKNRLSTGENHG